MIRYAIQHEVGIGAIEVRCHCGAQVASSHHEQVWITELAIGENVTVRKPASERDGVLCFGLANRRRRIDMLLPEHRVGKRPDRGGIVLDVSPSRTVAQTGYAEVRDYGPIVAETFDTWCPSCGMRLRVNLAA